MRSENVAKDCHNCC